MDALAVIGTLDSGADTSDFYSFQGFAGDLINLEIITIANRLNGFDTTVSIFDSLGNFVDYYGDNAFNDDEFEALDSQIIDLILPFDDTFFIQVDSFSAGATGDYELFVSRFNGASAIPEPGFGIVGIALLSLGLYRKRRKQIAFRLQALNSGSGGDYRTAR